MSLVISLGPCRQCNGGEIDGGQEFPAAPSVPVAQKLGSEREGGRPLVHRESEPLNFKGFLALLGTELKQWLRPQWEELSLAPCLDRKSVV